MTTLFWERLGHGTQDIVLLHGWGLNAKVWYNIQSNCSSYFRLHILDLPGYGRNNHYSSMSLQQMISIIWQQAPKNAIWLGWSLGGLIATSIALKYQSEVAALITVASSPCFIKKKNWPGIEPDVLNNFKQQLYNNFQHTITRFLNLQTLGVKNIYENLQLLKSMILKHPSPSITVLNAGLEILQTTDLRNSLNRFKKPFLRIYGDCDSLVPKKIIPIIDKLSPHSVSVIIQHAAHAPFISHSKQFIQLLIQFSNF